MDKNKLMEFLDTHKEFIKESTEILSSMSEISESYQDSRFDFCKHSKLEFVGPDNRGDNLIFVVDESGYGFTDCEYFEIPTKYYFTPDWKAEYTSELEAICKEKARINAETVMRLELLNKEKEIELYKTIKEKYNLD